MTRSPFRSKRVTWSGPFCARSMPMGFDPRPVDRWKNANTRIESRGISRKIRPWRSSRYRGMSPARRSIPPVRAAMFVPTDGPCPWPAPLAGGPALGCAPAGDVPVCGRAGAGAGLGDEAAHAEASNVATTPNEQATRMSGSLRKGTLVGDGECLAGDRRAQADVQTPRALPRRRMTSLPPKDLADDEQDQNDRDEAEAYGRDAPRDARLGRGGGAQAEGTDGHGQCRHPLRNS